MLCNLMNVLNSIKHCARLIIHYEEKEQSVEQMMNSKFPFPINFRFKKDVMRRMCVWKKR